MSSRSKQLSAFVLASALAVAACGGDDDDAGSDSTEASASTTAASAESTAEATEEMSEESGEMSEESGEMSEESAEMSEESGEMSEETTEAAAIDAERCQRNQDAGTITFVTGFDFAAAAGIAEIIAADAEGCFDELCIDVDIQPGFAPSNGALVIEGQAQMGMAGSFAELVANNVAGEGDLVAVLHWGRTAVEAIVLPEGSEVASFGDLCGNLVGIKGDLPYSLQAAVALSGIERSCFEEILLDGFDPVAHLELGIDALPVYKSNEPNTLESQGIPFTLLDPLEFDVPSSFGVPFTSQAFIDEHPEVVADIVRALIRGYDFAAANPEAAVDHAFELIDAAGNPAFLAKESELFRWGVESELIARLAPADVGVGIPDTELLGAEVEAMVAAGVFAELPDWQSMVNTELASAAYDGTTLVWPGS